MTQSCLRALDWESERNQPRPHHCGLWRVEDPGGETGKITARAPRTISGAERNNLLGSMGVMMVALYTEGLSAIRTIQTALRCHNDPNAKVHSTGLCDGDASVTGREYRPASSAISPTQSPDQPPPPRLQRRSRWQEQAAHRDPELDAADDSVAEHQRHLTGNEGDRATVDAHRRDEQKSEAGVQSQAHNQYRCAGTGVSRSCEGGV